jgi:multiple sugar transport system ATP-binding protein
MAEILLQDVRKDFGDFTAVKASSFKVEDGEFFMLLGPSGCGKTTTLRMIAGLELPTSGEIYIGGDEVGQKPASQRDIAFVFQMFALYPHLNVRQNISYPLVSQGMPRARVRAKVAEVAGILGIEDILDRPVGGLSGGDRQRVALGRAIVREPKCFLMDEPLGALDAEVREHMAEELRALHDRMGATTVYVTHDQLEAMQMGDKIVVMNHGQVEQWGTPQEIYDWCDR